MRVSTQALRLLQRVLQSRRGIGRPAFFDAAKGQAVSGSTAKVRAVGRNSFTTDDIPVATDPEHQFELAVSLGKLQVLLKPLADDPIHGMMKIPAAELRDAAELLGSVVDGLRQADPDRPIKPDEWLRLLSSVEEERFIASSLLATTARRTT